MSTQQLSEHQTLTVPSCYESAADVLAGDSLDSDHWLNAAIYYQEAAVQYRAIGLALSDKKPQGLAWAHERMSDAMEKAQKCKLRAADLQSGFSIW